DLDLGPMLAVLRLPRALLESAGDDDAHPLGQAQRHVLGQVPPTDYVEERRRLLPFLGRPVLPAPVDSHPELGGRLTLSGIPDLRFPSQIADDRRGVRHCILAFVTPSTSRA